MSETQTQWRPCGSTPYYRLSEGFGGFLVDPFNWRMISISDETIHGKRILMGVYHEAPRYDWDMLKNGVYYVSGSKDEERQILALTHEWFHDMTRVKQLKQNNKQIRFMFNDAPEEAKALVLKGAQALIQGYSLDYMKRIGQGEDPVRSKMVISIVSDTPMSVEMVGQIQAVFTGLDNTLIANNQEQALEQVLSEFGIFEC